MSSSTSDSHRNGNRPVAEAKQKAERFDRFQQEHQALAVPVAVFPAHPRWSLDATGSERRVGSRLAAC